MIVPLEDLVKGMKSHYKLVLTAAQRANELSKGMPSLIHTSSKKPARIALEEIAKGKVRYEEEKPKKAKASAQE